MIAARWMGFILLLVVSAAVKAGATPPSCVNTSLSQSATEVLEAAQQLADDGKVSQAVAFLTTQAEQPSYSDDRSALLLAAAVLAREDQQSMLAERYLHNAWAHTAENDVRRHTILKQLSALLLTQQRYREVVDLYDGVERCKSWVLEPPYNLAVAKLRLEDLHGVAELTQLAFDYLDGMPPGTFAPVPSIVDTDIKWQVLDLHAQCFLGREERCTQRWYTLFLLRREHMRDILEPALQAHVAKLQQWPEAQPKLDEARQAGCLQGGEYRCPAAPSWHGEISPIPKPNWDGGPNPYFANFGNAEGWVMLELYVDHRGEVESMRVIHSRPNSEKFKQAAIKSLEGIRFNVAGHIQPGQTFRQVHMVTRYLKLPFREAEREKGEARREVLIEKRQQDAAEEHKHTDRQ